ncbi:MAG: transporter substrate-binding domain-containing protein [Verrucomicrobia bacterium]|nr:transporter substrate-binding domain-containing protein [Verrucomicrobiota bacterium]
MELNFPPFEMLDTNGQPAGISVEMAKALGQFLHRQVRVENIPFDGLIPSLKTGKVDLVISSLTVSEDRKNSIDFSDPYLHMGLALLVKKDSSIQSIADVEKQKTTVAVKKGTTAHLYAIEHLKNAKLLVLNDDATCALEVAQGKADCFIYDQISIYESWRKYNDTTRPILKAFQQEEWAIGVRKGNDRLREEVNAFIKDFKANGSLENLCEKYLAENKEAFHDLGMQF